jgi:hypothetical protein
LVFVHLLLEVFIVLFTFIIILNSLKTVVVHRVEGASLRAVLLLRIAWCLEMCSLLDYTPVSEWVIPKPVNSKTGNIRGVLINC